MNIDIEGINEAERLCGEMREYPAPDNDSLWCDVVFDGWGCWNYTQAGRLTQQPCPWYIKEFDPSLLASRLCDTTGEWHVYPERDNRSWSNYTACVNLGDVKRDMQVIYMFVTGYSISIFTLLISLVIFFYFKQLQCDRITLHKHLFISYILNGVVWIPYYLEAAMKPDVIAANPVWCQVTHVITKYLVTCNFFWMFCEGLYLHTIIAVAFISGEKLVKSCYVIGWGIPAITTSIYSAIRGLDPQASNSCWLEKSDLDWIIFGPIIGTLVANVVFLCNIVRVLITKMRAVNNPDTNQTRKAVRATVILIPLLGLQFILFPFTPEEGTWMKFISSMGSAFVTSFQGFFVSLIFCFLNSEVLSVMKRKWRQHRLMRGKDFHRNTYYSQTRCPISEPPINPSTNIQTHQLISKSPTVIT